MIAKVHVAKAQLAMAEEDYRALLQRVTGLNSSSACSEAQLVRVLDEFKRLGWKPKERAVNPQAALIRQLWDQLGPCLRQPGPAGLRAYCRRMTRVDDPEWLDGAQANVVIEGLKAWLAREEANAAKAGATGDDPHA